MFEWNEVIIEDIPYFVFGLQSLLFHYLEVLQKNVRKLKVGLFKWCSPQAREIWRDHSGGVIPIFVPIPSMLLWTVYFLFNLCASSTVRKCFSDRESTLHLVKSVFWGEYLCLLENCCSWDAVRRQAGVGESSALLSAGNLLLCGAL